MGYGGDLLMSAALEVLADKTGKKIVPVYRPPISDLLAFRLYDSRKTLADNTVYKGNPKLCFNKVKDTPRHILLEMINRTFTYAVTRSGLENRWDAGLDFISRIYARWQTKRYIYVSAPRHSYAKSTTEEKITWKEEGHAVDAILSSFPLSERPSCPIDDPKGILILDTERKTIAQIMAEKELEPGRFVVIEPDTNRDWFGELRAWPIERWQQVVNQTIEQFPDIPFVQVGIGEQGLENVIDLRGKTSFREVCALIEKAKFFVGTEGGLMHAARAVDTTAVIVWGGVTLPAFAGYPKHHYILYNKVDCAPCGLRGNCPYGRMCILGVTQQQVFETMKPLLEKLNCTKTSSPAHKK